MGALDANGIYSYTETDLASPFSDLLNLLAGSTSDQVGALQSDVEGLLAQLLGRVLPYRVAAGKVTMGSAAWTPVTFPAGRFTQPPVVLVSPGSQGAYAAVKYAVTTTGFNGGVIVTNTGVLIASVFDWVAIQMTSTTAPGR